MLFCSFVSHFGLVDMAVSAPHMNAAPRRDNNAGLGAKLMHQFGVRIVCHATLCVKKPPLRFIKQRGLHQFE